MNLVGFEKANGAAFINADEVIAITSAPGRVAGQLRTNIHFKNKESLEVIGSVHSVISKIDETTHESLLTALEGIVDLVVPQHNYPEDARAVARAYAAIAKAKDISSDRAISVDTLIYGSGSIQSGGEGGS